MLCFLYLVKIYSIQFRICIITVGLLKELMNRKALPLETLLPFFPIILTLVLKYVNCFFKTCNLRVKVCNIKFL